uniref:28S ribosomal protein S24, mitochondrial n=1 Tax=Aceria tosichella TaxID=561515 RepID=A0A6G1SDV1_9ACAR
MMLILAKRALNPRSVDALSGFLRLAAIHKSDIHTTNVLAIKTAGRHKPTTKRDKPLTYEQANKPDMIGVRKSWNTFNTSGLVDSIRCAETAHEDILIRKFIHGTWPKLLASDVIIKRRGNQIVLNFMAVRMTSPMSIYFLIGYTEEILSYMLKSVVKLEIQTIDDSNDLVYKYI